MKYDKQLISIFPIKPILFFLIKYAVKRPRCQPWKRFDKWQKWEWQKYLDTCLCNNLHVGVNP